jgi:hypothetical protein
MLNWIIKNLANIGVVAALIVITALVIARIVKNKKEGKLSCGYDCANCPMGSNCLKKNGSETNAHMVRSQIKKSKRQDIR